MRTAPSNSDRPRWYVAKENETPRIIARILDLNCLHLIEANRARLPELLSNSRLKAGTRIKISHFHVHDDLLKPYAHCTFPDDTFEDGEPSYMMALKLNRCRGALGRTRPFLETLAVPLSPYEPTPLLLPLSPDCKSVSACTTSPTTPAVGIGRRSGRPLKHSPQATYLGPRSSALFGNGRHETNSSELDLYNCVVKLKPGAITEVSEHQYWYVRVLLNRDNTSNWWLCPHSLGECLGLS